MKKIILTFSILLSISTIAQDRFSGISTSSQVGILNGVNNPAEFANLAKNFEINGIGINVGLANNTVSISDLSSDIDLVDIIFSGNEPVNLRIEASVLGPSFAMKWKEWGFGITTKANTKADLVDFDPTFGRAIVNDYVPDIINNVNVDENQRFYGIAWGEIGLSVARTVYENEKHKVSAGATFNLLFPGTYSNFGIDNLSGKIVNSDSGTYLVTNQPSNLNISYSGNLGNEFTDANDFTSSVFGGLNGVSADIGLNYQLKDETIPNKYKIKVGLSVRNIGSMTFKDDNNYATNYNLDIPVNNPLNLELFTDSNNLGEVEDILRDNGYLVGQPQDKRNFKVAMPTLFTMYADFRVLSKLYLTGYWQQSMKNNNGNEQITALNVFSVTPRVLLGSFEAFVPFTTNNVSDLSVGFGFRLGGFYLGSNALFSALLADNKAADIYMGFRVQFM